VAKFFDRINVPERICEDWWAGVVEKVRKAIDTKRANVTNAIKLEFIRKYRETIKQLNKHILTL